MRPIGLVLSGGGARGAYEVGVLLYIARTMPELLSRIRVITGSSVGAVNGVYVASRGLTPSSVQDLAEFWRKLRLDEIVSVSGAGALKMFTRAGLRLIANRGVKSPATALLSVEGLWKIVMQKTDWKNLHREIRHGRFDAVAAAATDIASGQTHLFVEGRRDLIRGLATRDPVLELKPTYLGPHQVLASAAIPVLFPPVRVHGRWYMDGGVRYNTPLSPALYFGAESLVIITVRAMRPVSPPSAEFPGMGQMIGKLLDSIFLDRIAFDLDRLLRINDMVESVSRLGDEALARFRNDIQARGRRPYRVVPIAAVRPSQDLGAIAARYLAESGHSLPGSFGRVLRALFEDDTETSGDAASFLLFDGGYAERLIAAGLADAEASREALERL